MRIDPHTHSTASDGRSRPRELMQEAAAAGVTTIGLTDHDTIAGWAEAAAEVGNTGVSLIRGMEVSTKYQGVSTHIVAYLFNPADPSLMAHIERVRSSRLGRAQRIVERLGVDTPLVWDDVEAVVAPGATIGRPHIADALIVRGVVVDRNEAFVRYLAPDSPYYVPHYAPDAIQAVEWINQAGGKAVLAHPRAPHRGRVLPERVFHEMAEAGLFGIEIDHRDNAATQIPELERTAHSLHLARFGSSDYHGSGKPNRLGENTTSPAVISALTQGCFLEVLNP